ncbi:MAG: hypothetical protein L0Y74_07285 [candidate division Zixibacteria bacterium]|nr:hypothetical protein [candidate division Zixibacteria bacterium]
MNNNYSKGKNHSRRNGLKLPSKTHWHLYSLQGLSYQKFVSVVNKVLKQEFYLIK